MNTIHSSHHESPSLGETTGEVLSTGEALDTEKPSVAVVILNWNGERMLATYLSSVVRYSSSEAVVYVADNASTDGSIDLLRREFPQVRLLRLDRNYGFAEGYNRALAMVQADYYVLLNSDVEVTRHWLTPLVEWMEHHPETAACQPKLLALAQHDCFEYAGAAGGFIDRYGYPYCRGRVFDTVERDGGQYDQVMEVHWATGACMMIRANDYRRVGGLDGRFFAHCEEIDLCWRLRIDGRKVVCIPGSHVYHLGGGTLPKGNPRKTFLNFRNNLTMLYKNLPDNALHHVMRCRWWLDYFAAMKMLLLDRSWADFRAVCQARRAYKRWRSDFNPDRRRIHSSPSVPLQSPPLASEDTGEGSANSSLLSPFSLLWQYYVRRRKTFSALPGSECEQN